MRANRLLAGVLAPAAIAGALAVIAATPGTAQAKSKLITANHVNAAKCIPGPNGTVRAQMSMWMRVVNYHNIDPKNTDWATGMRPQIRLEATTPGFQYTRVWKYGVWANGLLQDHKYTKYWTLTSDNLSGTADWQIRVKMVWDRPFPVPDVVKTGVFSFNNNCATGQGLPAAPPVALPSSS